VSKHKVIGSLFFQNSPEEFPQHIQTHCASHSTFGIEEKPELFLFGQSTKHVQLCRISYTCNCFKRIVPPRNFHVISTISRYMELGNITENRFISKNIVILERNSQLHLWQCSSFSAITCCKSGTYNFYISNYRAVCLVDLYGVRTEVARTPSTLTSVTVRLSEVFLIKNAVSLTRQFIPL
jgi:hypothetical protein